MLKKTFLFLFPLTACFNLSAQNPEAHSEAQILSGNARFTVLTDRLIRMEWSENGNFEDNATLAIINRELDVPLFTTETKGDTLEIKTNTVTLKYIGNDPFNQENLQVSFPMNQETVIWYTGKEDTGNLMGTARTLDGCRGAEKINFNDPMEPGILSRDGWAVVDESKRHILVKNDSDWGEWVEQRPEGNIQDLYIFAYGHDYKDALSDFTKIAGKIPLPPKYVFGYWWSRYWAYTDEEFLELAKEFRDRELPIDVMVIDMDWHHTWQNTGHRLRRDELGESVGWTGYSWNRDLFNDPESFLADLHEMNLKTSLNLHPASGIVVREEVYPAFVADYLSRTDDYDGPEGYIYKGGEEQGNGRIARKGWHAPVAYRMDQPAWADAYFNSVIHPLENQGVDFWWLDWQQYKESKYIPALSNTFWINYAFFNDKVRRTKDKAPEDVTRPMIYHRWGGLGSHRYQLGFSGDTNILWSVLEYLPYFTATASNVGYGYWGHDLGGHMQREEIPTDPELYTRWLQYGVFSPLFKTHSTSSNIIERRFWAFEDHYPYMKDALELRYALTPYIYDMARQAYNTGVSLCRPMYYEYPEEDKAYDFKEQYFFGDNIMAATVCQPVDSVTGLADRTVWFPGGEDWYDMAHRTMRKGDTVQDLKYGIDQNAWFVKAGSIIPMAKEGIQNLQEKTNALRLYIAPGAGESSYIHFEDDEISQAYPDQFASTLIEKSSDDNECIIKIAAREGSYKGMDPERELTIVLGGMEKAPVMADVNGKKVSAEYSSEKKEATINLPLSKADTPLEVKVRY